MTVTPQSQGTLDGLCGLYAIVNALDVTTGRASAEEIFQCACASLGQSRWPSVLWEGTTFTDLQRMIRKCANELELSDVEIRYPFRKRPPTSNDEYWERFDRLFSEDGVSCAIMGVTSPMMHWIVAGYDGAHVQLMDSTAGRPFLRKRRSSLFAGERRQKPNQWLLNRSELITFARS